MEASKITLHRASETAAQREAMHRASETAAQREARLVERSAYMHCQHRALPD